MEENAVTTTAETRPTIPDSTLPFTCEWLEDANGKYGGSILTERTFNLQPMTDRQAQAWLGSIIIIRTYNKEGDETGDDIEDLNAITESIFDEICPGATDVPVEVKSQVLARTHFNVEANRAIFRKGDPKAPAPGEAAIDITYWHPDGEKTARLYLRIPEAQDKKNWLATTKKRPPEKDQRGRILSEAAGVSVQKLHEVMHGNQLKNMQPLYLRAEGYEDFPDGRPPFFHLNQSLSCLFTEPKNLGEASRRLNAKSSTA